MLSLMPFVANRLSQWGRRLVEAESPHNVQQIWYAGMVAEPAEFARQLSSLQASLQRANAPVVRQSPSEAPAVSGR